MIIYYYIYLFLMIIWGYSKPWKGHILNLLLFYTMIIPLLFITEFSGTDSLYDFEKYYNKIGFLIIAFLMLFNLRYKYTYKDYFNVFNVDNDPIKKDKTLCLLRVLLLIFVIFTLVKIYSYGF